MGETTPTASPAVQSAVSTPYSQPSPFNAAALATDTQPAATEFRPRARTGSNTSSVSVTQLASTNGNGATMPVINRRLSTDFTRMSSETLMGSDGLTRQGSVLSMDNTAQPLLASGPSELFQRNLTLPPRYGHARGSS